MEKVYAIQDDSGHWYVIPSEERKVFRELLEKAENDNYEAQDEFIYKYSKYRTGGDLNNIQLYAEI